MGPGLQHLTPAAFVAHGEIRLVNKMLTVLSWETWVNRNSTITPGRGARRVKRSGCSPGSFRHVKRAYGGSRTVGGRPRIRPRNGKGRETRNRDRTTKS